MRSTRSGSRPTATQCRAEDRVARGEARLGSRRRSTGRHGGRRAAASSSDLSRRSGSGGGPGPAAAPRGVAQRGRSGLVGDPLAIEQAADQRHGLGQAIEPLAEARCRSRCPKASCSSSNQPPPMPRIARPPLMWSTVVASFAVSPGLRNVLAATSRPSRARGRHGGQRRQRRPALELRVVAIGLVGEEVVVDPEVVGAARPRPRRRRPAGTASRSAGPRRRRRSGSDGGSR